MSFAILKERREKITAEQRGILDLCIRANRDMTAGEKERYDILDDDFTKVQTDIKELEAAVRRSELAQREETPWYMPRPQDTRHRDSYVTQAPDVQMFNPGEFRAKFKAVKATMQDKQDLLVYLTRGINFLPEQAKMRFVEREVRANTAQMSKDTTGGFLLADAQFASEVLIDLADRCFIWDLARTIVLKNAQSLVFPKVSDKFDDSDWTSELSTGGETDMALQQFMLSPKWLAKKSKWSRSLINRMGGGADALIRTGLAESFANTLERAFMLGNGAGQPLGLFIPSGNGISTARDVSTGNSTTEIKADNLIEVVGSIKAQYRKKCSWIFSRTAMTAIRRLKTGDGRYLFEPTSTLGRPDILLGYPVYESEFCPSTFTTGQYVGLLGDLAQFFVCVSMNLEIQVLTELYAETNEIGYIGRMEVDAAPAQELAFARVTLG